MGVASRILIATLLSAAFLFVYDVLVLKPRVKRQTAQLPQKSTELEQRKYESESIKEKQISVPERLYQNFSTTVAFENDNVLVEMQNLSFSRIYLKKFKMYYDREEKFHFDFPLELIFFSDGSAVRFDVKKDGDKFFLFSEGITGYISFSGVSDFVFEMSFTLYGKNIAVKPVLVLRKSMIRNENSSLISAVPSLKELNKLKGGEVSDFFGERGRYFLFLVMPSFRTRFDSFEGERAIFSGDSVAGNNSVEFRIKFFSGPKDEKELNFFTGSAKELASFGTFHLISKALVYLLELINSFVGNWGVSIIVLSFLVRLALFPLSAISYKSFKKMKELQPEIEKIKEKYKDDKERMSREIFELYRKEKINPFSGCLPLLLQIPIFIALYQALLNSIDLRHAPFAFWIKDLSSPDKLFTITLGSFSFEFHLLPIIMGITFLVQQIITPQTSQDVSMKILNYLMPAMFVFILWGVPSGLHLYWITVNILGIIQQVITMKL